MDLLIRSGRVIDPASATDGVADILIQGGRIAACRPHIDIPPAAHLIDASGLIVSPGFIDLHTHLRFPGFPEKETLQTGMEAAAAGGFTTICAMANTSPVIDDPDLLRDVLTAAERLNTVHVHQLAAVSKNLAGRELAPLPALAAAGAIAFSDDGKPVADPALMHQALIIARDLGKPISVHEEDPSIVGKGVANAGEFARRLGLAEWPCEGEAAMVLRDINLLAQTGGRLHIAHVSCVDTVTALRAARRRGLSVTAEVTPHHLRLTDRLLEGDPRLELPPAHPCVKVNPPLRSAADVEAMIDALADGTIDAVATDHAPHTAQDKAGPFAAAAFGFTGIELALPLLLDLVRAGRLTLATMIARLTTGPARAFNLEAGTLRSGVPADITIFAPEESWSVTPNSLRSRGKNTPLLGAELRGRVRYTIVGGRIIHAL